MKPTEMQHVFLFIADLFKSFKPPTTEIGVQTWMEQLGDVSSENVVLAVKRVFAEEEFFSFAKLREKLNLMTQPQLPEPGEVIQTIKRLARNKMQDISNQPEHIRRTVSYLGGLKVIGEQEWNDWYEKKIANRYEEAKSSMGKQELQQLGMAAERLGIE